VVLQLGLLLHGIRSGQNRGKEMKITVETGFGSHQDFLDWANLTRFEGTPTEYFWEVDLILT
jgi:hypothetical protein